VQVHLLFSAGTKQKDLFAFHRRLDALPIQGVIFTKLDESCTYGNLLGFIKGTRLPVSYLAAGKNVPDDLEEGSLEKVLARMCGLSPVVPAKAADDGPGAGLRAGPIGGLVANKNSDVYHRARCNWATKIKAENCIYFETPAQAENNNFTPCKNCHPQRSVHPQVPLRPTAERRVSRLA